MNPWWMWKLGKGLSFLAVALTVFGLIVMLLWNALVPELFGGPFLSFWQAVGLLTLSHILLRGWAPWRYGKEWRDRRWKQKLEEKLAAMTPEEREQFKEEWKHRCGYYPGEEKEEKKEAGG
jgi:membrane protein implicated in regulation of membrane protease activity